MKETIVVSVSYGNYDRDFELPCKTELSELYPRFLSVMKQIDPGSFTGIREIFFRHGNVYLRDSGATLADYGIVTGAKLELIRER